MQAYKFMSGFIGMDRKNKNYLSHVVVHQMTGRPSNLTEMASLIVKAID
jgi:hypothetical protein